MGDVYGKPRRYSLEAKYISYSDIVENASNPQTELSETITFNFNFRFYRIFSLISTYGTTTPSEWSYYGLGLRCELPGFFFFGGNANDFVRQRKNRRVNTHMTYFKLSATQVGLDKRFIDDKLSFGGDIFLAGNVYLNFDLGLLSHQGNQFFAPAIGLGYEF
jgi:hypothetical protein